MRWWACYASMPATETRDHNTPLPDIPRTVNPSHHQWNDNQLCSNSSNDSNGAPGLQQRGTLTKTVAYLVLVSINLHSANNLHLKVSWVPVHVLRTENSSSGTTRASWSLRWSNHSSNVLVYSNGIFAVTYWNAKWGPQIYLERNSNQISPMNVSQDALYMGNAD